MDGLRILAVPGIGEVEAGTDLSELIGSALLAANLLPQDGDILCVTSKVVSKARGLTAEGTDKRAVVAEQSVRVVAERMTATGPTRIVEGRHGVVMAGAGVDASNAGPSGRLLLLPDDPDAAAADLLVDLTAYLRLRLGRSPRLGLIVSDTAGRPWRGGQTDFALGAAGVRVLLDHRGGQDADGRPLEVTAIAVADEIAAAADLVKGKAEGLPVALIRGLEALVVSGEPGARRLLRTGPGDFFALGHVEAARAALGAAPGSPIAASVGIRAVGTESLDDRVARAIRLAVDVDPVVAGTLEVALERTDATIQVRLSGADPYAVGRAHARLEVALWSEGLSPESLPCAGGRRATGPTQTPEGDSAQQGRRDGILIVVTDPHAPGPREEPR